MTNLLERRELEYKNNSSDIEKRDLSETQNTQSVEHNGPPSSLYEHVDTDVTFRTTAPSPSPASKSVQHYMVSDHVAQQPDAYAPYPLQTSLRLQTDLPVPSAPSNNATLLDGTSDCEKSPNTRPIGIPVRTPSVKHAITNSYGSQSNYGSASNSTVSSPMLMTLGNVTPLPSPIMSSDSPGPWRKFAARQKSREYMKSGSEDSAFVTRDGESISNAPLVQPKRKAYHGLVTNASDVPGDVGNGTGHGRNRSVSEFVPEIIHGAKARQHTVSGSYTISELEHEGSTETQMRREPNLAAIRGMAPMLKPLTPPFSSAGGGGGGTSDADIPYSQMETIQQVKNDSQFQHFDAYTKNDQKRRWRVLKLLGEGTFSKVMLATSDISKNDVSSTFAESANTAEDSHSIELRKLVAVKICEHGPKGGASEERVEMSLKRELEIMKTVSHPSLIHLVAWNVEDTRALLVMSYCPGGDLFDVASQHKELLVPSLLQRILAELVGAIHFLHERHIVHRDIKLENVLVNVPQSELAKDVNWVTYPYSIISLTDLGLSRRVADDEKLTTRCGSDDYAAPEVIMGQSYDGRAVDAWSLGVLLYALIEARLPFDPSPGMSEGHKQRSKTSHRIARVEWCWVEFAGDDGDHESDEKKFEECGLKGAMEITEGLLRRARNRWTVDKVKQHDWIREAIHVDGGIRFRDLDIAEEV